MLKGTVTSTKEGNTLYGKDLVSNFCRVFDRDCSEMVSAHLRGFGNHHHGLEMLLSDGDGQNQNHRD